MHVLEGYPARGTAERRACRVTRLGRQVDHLFEPCERAAGDLETPVDIRQPANRTGEQCGIEQECEQVARIAPPAGQRLAADHQHRDRRQRRDQRDDRADHRIDPRLPEHEGARGLRLRDILAVMTVLVGENLDRGHHGEIALGGDHHFGFRAPGLARQHPQAASDQLHHDEEHRHHQRHDQRHRRIDQEQQNHRAACGKQHRRRIGEGGGEETAEVRYLERHQRQDVARAALLMERHRHVDDVVVDFAAQPRKDLQRCRRRDDGRDDIERGQADQRYNQQHQRLARIPDRAADHSAEQLPRQPRDGQCRD